MLEEFSDRDLELADDPPSVVSKEDLYVNGTKSPGPKKEKKNPVLGRGKNGSIILKLINKQSKKEVAMKEISKKGKR